MVENSPVMVSWRSSKPPERVRGHSRTFRNPPQPHMCIQDFLEVHSEHLENLVTFIQGK